MQGITVAEAREAAEGRRRIKLTNKIVQGEREREKSKRRNRRANKEARKSRRINRKK